MPKIAREVRIPKMSPAIPGGYVLSKIDVLKATTGQQKNNVSVCSARRDDMMLPYTSPNHL